MSELLKILKYLGISIVAVIWIYIAVRMSARAVLRSIEEWRKKNG